MSIPMVQGLQLYMPSGSKHRANKTREEWKMEGTKSCLKAVKFKFTHKHTHTNYVTKQNPSER